MSSPKVSIVMPCYQNGKTLGATVASICAQTFGDWELIAVNDGSKDDTLGVLRALEAQEARMRVIDQANGGVSAARNAGIDASRGEWLFFADADDLLEPRALETLLAMTDEETDIVCGAYVMRYTDEGNREENHACAEGDRQVIYESLIRGDSALNSMCARLYRADMIRRHALRVPVGVKVGEDMLFNLDAFCAARSWRMTREVVYVYLFGGDSAMTRARNDRFARSVPMIEGIGRFIERHGLQTQLFRAHIDIYLRTLRADRGRFRAALTFGYSMGRSVTRGVNPRQLDMKQRAYYLALRLMPCLSYLIP